MRTVRLSSKGQVTIPKSMRTSHCWRTGLELQVLDTGDGLLLKPKAPFAPVQLHEVVGMLKDKAPKRSDAEIKAALRSGVRRLWHGRS